MAVLVRRMTRMMDAMTRVETMTRAVMTRVSVLVMASVRMFLIVALSDQAEATRRSDFCFRPSHPG
jgi:hypothetical protein